MRIVSGHIAFWFGLFMAAMGCGHPLSAATPNIILVMADDQGWGETGYYQHPVLKTPNLDAMADAGLRFDRFYAGAPVCSPTRASVLTGRSNLRTGVESHGYALHRQETTLAQGLQAAGYRTGHFGKWHLNGLRGPGVPVLASDKFHPGIFGFDEWLSVTNFFDRNPILSRRGKFEEFMGDSSEIVVAQALEFIASQAAAERPSFTVIWFGTPHSPFVAADDDMRDFAALDKNSRNHYGELVAMDRSIGQLRGRLRELGIAENTILWFCSDNGGLPNIEPATVGGLRGFKGSLYEGGLRVPAVVEWPARISAGRTTSYPAVTMDILPTLAEVVNLPSSPGLAPQDGCSLLALFDAELGRRDKPIPFGCFGELAWVDNQWKLLRVGKGNKTHFELYDLANDPAEQHNLADSQASRATQMQQQLLAWEESVAASIAGKDYASGAVADDHPQPRFWTEVEAYQPYFESWKERPEYRSRLK